MDALVMGGAAEDGERERLGSMIRLLAFVLPLGVDSFAVAAALGAARPAGIAMRLRVSLIFVVFEAGMPLLGLAAGGGLARVIGTTADYLAGAAVIGVGVWMLASGDDDEARAGRVPGAHGLAVIALGVSISIDELAIGFSLGLARLPVVPVIVAIAVLALAASQLGLALGAVVGERFRERAAQAAALALIALGGYLIAERALS
jgi:manganese efflux pump family protein